MNKNNKSCSCIIGCIGVGQSGKDEFAKIAVKEFNATRVAFADAVKEEVSEFLKENNIPFEDRNLWGDGPDKEELFNFHHFTIKELDDIIEPYVEIIGESKYVSFRSLLQVWGTDYRRSQDENYWIKKGLAKCRETGGPYTPFGMTSIQYMEHLKEKQKNQIYAISDVRFLNETKAIKAVGGKLVKIVRSDAPEISNMSHQSEQELKDYEGYDYLILNNGTLEEYHNNCKKVIEKILKENKYV